jgi:hypothetical protein
MAAKVAVRCGLCGEVFSVASNREYRVLDADGRRSTPAHLKGKCNPKTRSEYEMAARKTTTKKKAATKKAVTKKAATKKVPATKAGSRKKTLSGLIYGMLDGKKTDEAIKKAVAKEFPDSKFNDHQAAHLAWYKNAHAKR